MTDFCDFRHNDNAVRSGSNGNEPVSLTGLHDLQLIESQLMYLRSGASCTSCMLHGASEPGPGTDIHGLKGSNGLRDS